jgi:hypothetical protein
MPSENRVLSNFVVGAECGAAFDDRVRGNPTTGAERNVVLNDRKGSDVDICSNLSGRTDNRQRMNRHRGVPSQTAYLKLPQPDSAEVFWEFRAWKSPTKSWFQKNGVRLAGT